MILTKKVAVEVEEEEEDLRRKMGEEDRVGESLKIVDPVPGKKGHKTTLTTSKELSISRTRTREKLG